MKISAFTFLRNGEMLGYPFVASLRSLLPLVDEFVIALGPCEDNTQAMIEAIADDKIKIIHTTWNENIRQDFSIKGFVYGQQKSIAQFNCTGDWAFYLEGDEVVHEEDIEKIRATMLKYKDDDDVEALVFDYVHFYGNKNTYAWSPAWYRTEVRVIKNTIPIWGPKGLFFTVQTGNHESRYPKAAHTGAKIYHYGWVRNEDQMKLKDKKAGEYLDNKTGELDYRNFNQDFLKPFTGTHPRCVQSWLPEADGIFEAYPNYTLNRRERRHVWTMKIEKWLGIDLSRKHFKLVK